ncbi:MAG: aldo/keto reductase [Colwellia sp.]|nr:aldo/keto reductase [Colwellia sp.]
MKSKRATIGKTGLEVSQIGFSGENLHSKFFQNQLKSEYQETSFKPFTDVNFYDSSPLSGYGMSERIIGNTLRHLKKSTYVLSATVGRLLKPVNSNHSTLPTIMPFKASVDYSYNGIIRAFEDSLLRMGVAKVDLLIIESLDSFETTAEYTYQIRQLLNSGLKAIEYLKAQRLISAVGLKFSNSKTFHTIKIHSNFDCFFIEGIYCLLKQDHVFELIPIIKQYGASVIIVDEYNYNAEFYNLGRENNRFDNEVEILKDKISKIRDICFEFNTTLETVALQFPYINSIISSVIPKVSTSVEFEKKISLLNEHIPNDLWRTLMNLNLIDKNIPTIDYHTF